MSIPNLMCNHTHTVIRLHMAKQNAWLLYTLAVRNTRNVVGDKNSCVLYQFRFLQFIVVKWSKFA